MTAAQPDDNERIAIGMIAAALLGMPMPAIEVLGIDDVRSVAYTLCGIASGFAATLTEAGYDPVGALERISYSGAPGSVN